MVLVVMSRVNRPLKLLMRWWRLEVVLQVEQHLVGKIGSVVRLGKLGMPEMEEPQP